MFCHRGYLNQEISGEGRNQWKTFSISS